MFLFATKVEQTIIVCPNSDFQTWHMLRQICQSLSRSDTIIMKSGTCQVKQYHMLCLRCAVRQAFKSMEGAHAADAAVTFCIAVNIRAHEAKLRAGNTARK